MKISVQRLDSTLSSRLAPIVVELERRLERTLQGPVVPNSETSFNLYKFRKQREIVELAIVSWYLREDLGILLRLELEQVKFTSREYLPILLLKDKETCLQTIRFFQSERDFFGNLLPELRKTASRLYLRCQIPRLARRKCRRRGYSDHGSVRPLSSWLPTMDLAFVEEQNRIEAENDFHEARKETILLFGLMGIRLWHTEVEEGLRKPPAVDCETTSVPTEV